MAYYILSYMLHYSSSVSNEIKETIKILAFGDCFPYSRITQHLQVVIVGTNEVHGGALRRQRSHSEDKRYTRCNYQTDDSTSWYHPSALCASSVERMI